LALCKALFMFFRFESVVGTLCRSTSYLSFIRRMASKMMGPILESWSRNPSA
jgi:hypothetical protein